MRILDSPLIPPIAEAELQRKGSPLPDFSPLTFADEMTLPLPTYKAAQTSEFDIAGLLSKPLRLREDLTSGCGGQTWPAGMVLAKHMLRYHREDLNEARILELGAGGGLVGLAVASGCQLQPSSSNKLLLSDQAEMVSLMQHNIALNDLGNQVEPLVLNWGEALPRQVIESRPNVILAADCVYFEPAFPLLLQTLTELLTLNEDATIYFCFKKRRRADNKFFKTAQKLFLVEAISDEDKPAFSRESIHLYSLRSKKRFAPKPAVTRAVDGARQ